MGRHWHRWRDRREVPIPEVGSWAGPSPRWHNRLSLDQLWCWGGVGLLDYRDAEAKWYPKGKGLPGPLRERTGPQEANTEKQQQPRPLGRPKVLRQPLEDGHLLGTNPQSLSPGASG